jgi:selenocysteine-specific elongation factor
LFNQVAALAVQGGIIEQDESSVWLVDHEVRLTAEQQREVDLLLQRFERVGYASPSVSECVEQVGEDVYGALVEQGTLIALNEDVVYLNGTVAEMQERVVAYIRQEGAVTVAQVRDLLDASRKYALALMEYLDERRITRRVGDTRVLRGRVG